MTKVKICGIREAQHLIAAAQHRADFVGLVFAPSRRQVTPATAKQIIEKARSVLAQLPKVVGIFVNASADQVNAIAEECGLDYVQLSGREPWSYCSRIKRPVIKAIHIDEAGYGPEGLATLARTCAEARLRDCLVLLDSGSDRMPGGTGQTFDWAVAAELADKFDFLLAGGLTPTNVADAIEIVHPWGVDVSTGVETGGVKDPAKIEAFIEAVRNSSVHHRRN